MSAKPEAADAAPAPAKSKKMLIIVLVAVLVLVLGGAGAFFFISRQHAATADGEETAAPPPPKVVAHAVPKNPPVYLPLDSMVVNLADPGGDRVAQIGITLEVLDAKAIDSVKAFLPSIRSSVLMLISQRTADVLLSPEGKEKLAEDILREAAVPFGGGEEEDDSAKKKKRKPVNVEYPVTGVLFSSFIVQ